MKKYYYILTLGLLAGLASCTKDEIPNAEMPDGVKSYSSFNVTVEDSMPETRAFLVNDTKFYFINSKSLSKLVIVKV